MRHLEVITANAIMRHEAPPTTLNL
jgi:hypothetical protein